MIILGPNSSLSFLPLCLLARCITIIPALTFAQPMVAAAAAAAAVRLTPSRLGYDVPRLDGGPGGERQGSMKFFQYVTDIALAAFCAVIRPSPIY